MGGREMENHEGLGKINMSVSGILAIWRQGLEGMGINAFQLRGKPRMRGFLDEFKLE